MLVWCFSIPLLMWCFCVCMFFQQQKDSDFEEMEAWLNEQPVPAPREETISSSEFDRFLEERAAAADALPTITAATGSSGPRQRTLARDDKDTNQMFAL